MKKAEVSKACLSASGDASAKAPQKAQGKAREGINVSEHASTLRCLERVAILKSPGEAASREPKDSKFAPREFSNSFPGVDPLRYL